MELPTVLRNVPWHRKRQGKATAEEATDSDSSEHAQTSAGGSTPPCSVTPPSPADNAGTSPVDSWNNGFEYEVRNTFIDFSRGRDFADSDTEDDSRPPARRGRAHTDGDLEFYSRLAQEGGEAVRQTKSLDTPAEDSKSQHIPSDAVACSDISAGSAGLATPQEEMAASESGFNAITMSSDFQMNATDSPNLDCVYSVGAPFGAYFVADGTYNTLQFPDCSMAAGPVGAGSSSLHCEQSAMDTVNENMPIIWLPAGAATWGYEPLMAQGAGVQIAMPGVANYWGDGAATANELDAAAAQFEVAARQAEAAAERVREAARKCGGSVPGGATRGAKAAASAGSKWKQEAGAERGTNASNAQQPPSTWQPLDDAPTTVMLRNFPNDYTRDMLLDLMDKEGFKGFYDFVYMPMDFYRRAGFGYAFVNLTTHENAKKVRDHFQGFSAWSVKSLKVCEVAWGEPLQGLTAHVDRFRNSPVMHEDVPDEYKPVLLEDGVRVAFPPPTKRLRPPRLKHRPAPDHNAGLRNQH